MAFYEHGELERLRGRYADAEAAFSQAAARGHPVQPGLALLRLGQGRIDTAVASIRRALAERHDSLLSFFASLFESDYAGELATTRCPLLYVHGRTPTDLERLRALRPDATIEQAAGPGHYVMLTAADRINAMLERFLSSLG